MLNPSHSAGGTGKLFPDATLSRADGGSLSIDSFRPRYDLVILMLAAGAIVPGPECSPPVDNAVIADEHHSALPSDGNMTAGFGRVERDCQTVPAVNGDDRHRQVHELALVKLLARSAI
jgi:hypothetical protein